VAIGDRGAGGGRRWRATLSANAYAAIVFLYLIAITGLYLADPFFVKALRLLAFDSYQRISPLKNDVDYPVRIVDIDEQSLATIGQWPWPRTTMAALVDRLREKGAAVVAFDVMFPEPDQTSLEQITRNLPGARASELSRVIALWRPNDAVFADAIKAIPTVLAVSLSNSKVKSATIPQKAGFAIAGDNPLPFLNNTEGYVGNLPALTQVAAGLGSINWIADRDGVVRRVPLLFRVGSTIVPSLASEALRVAQGAGSYLIKSSNASGETAFGAASGINHVRIGSLAVPTDPDGALWLHYRASNPASFIPAWKVLQGKVEGKAIRGNIILVGTSAAGLVDLRATPLDAAVPGVEIHQQLIEHILSGQFLTRPDYAPVLEIFIVLLLGVLLAFIFPRVTASIAALIGIVVLVLLNIGSWALFRYQGLLFDSLYPSASILLLVAGSTFHLYRRTELQRTEIRHAFGQYVSPTVVEQLVANPERLVLGGEVRELTLLFSDVRNFTHISEGLTAEELTSFINELLTPLTDIIIASGGTIDKYMGDAVMAFWNAPLDDPDHARHALEAAAAMRREMKILNERWKKNAADAGRPYREVAIGIGINTGPCCVGNLGSSKRFDYSAIGDDVNVASRFEGLTKFYDVPLITSETTVASLPDLPFLEIDLVRVKGREKPSRIYTLLSLLDLADDQAQMITEAHRDLLEQYRKADWSAAEYALTKCRVAGISEFETLYGLYEMRISEHKKAPPPSDWDAIYALEDK
jgi:adenylate cyclase